MRHVAPLLLATGVLSACAASPRNAAVPVRSHADWTRTAVIY